MAYLYRLIALFLFATSHAYALFPASSSYVTSGASMSATGSSPGESQAALLAVLNGIYPGDATMTNQTNTGVVYRYKGNYWFTAGTTASGPLSCPANSTIAGSSCTCNSGYQENAAKTACELIPQECPKGQTASATVAYGWVQYPMDGIGMYKVITGVSKDFCVQNGNYKCSASGTGSSMGLKTSEATNGYAPATVYVSGTLTGTQCATITPDTVTTPAPPCQGQSGTVNGVSVCYPNESAASKQARAEAASAQAAASASAAASAAAKAAGASDAVASSAATAAATAAGSAAYNYVMGSASATSSSAALSAGASAGAAAGNAVTAGKTFTEAQQAGRTAAASSTASTSVSAGLASSSLSSAAQSSTATAAANAAAAASADAATAGVSNLVSSSASNAAADAAASSLAASALAAAKAATDAAIAAGKTAAEQAAAATAAANAAAADAANQLKAAQAAKAAADSALAAAKAKAETPTNDINDFCKSNPKSVICKEGLDSTWSGSCGAAPACSGDAISCAIAAASFRAACALDPGTSAEATLYNDNKDKTGDQTSAAAGQPVTISASSFNTTELLGAGQGLQNLNITVWGKSIVVPLSDLNIWLERLGMVLQAVTFILAIRIVSRG